MQPSLVEWRIVSPTSTQVRSVQFDHKLNLIRLKSDSCPFPGGWDLESDRAGSLLQDMSSEAETVRSDELNQGRHAETQAKPNEEVTAPTSSLPALQLLCEDLARIINDTKNHASVQEQLQAMNNAIQGRILRTEELGTLVRNARAGWEEAKQDIIPELLRQTQEMEATYRKIDRVQAMLNNMEVALNSITERAGQVERMLPSSSLASKLGSFLSSAFSGASASNTEAPINPIPLIPSTSDYFYPIPENYQGAITPAPVSSPQQQQSQQPHRQHDTSGATMTRRPASASDHPADDLP